VIYYSILGIFFYDTTNIYFPIYFTESLNQTYIQDKGSRFTYATITKLNDDQTKTQRICNIKQLFKSLQVYSPWVELVLLIEGNFSIESLQPIVNEYRITIYNIKPDLLRSIDTHVKKADFIKIWLWKLVQYDKVIYIDNKYHLKQNVVRFFSWPEISLLNAQSKNTEVELLVLSPSLTTFNKLIEIILTMQQNIPNFKTLLQYIESNKTVNNLLSIKESISDVIIKKDAPLNGC